MDGSGPLASTGGYGANSSYPATGAREHNPVSLKARRDGGSMRGNPTVKYKVSADNEPGVDDQVGAPKDPVA